MTDSPGSGPERTEPAAVGPAGVDLGRRRFFRQFAAEVIGAAAQVAGVATALQQSSAEAAGALLDPPGAASRFSGSNGTVATPVFRTAFRWETDRVVVIDQRRLPESIVEVEARTAAEVGQLMRERAVVGAPLLGQLAAIGLALTADRVRGSQTFARRATMRGSASALTNANPASMSVRVATERMLDRFVAVGELEEDGAAVSAALFAEAQAIVAEATAAHGRIAEVGAAYLEAVSSARPGVLAPEAIGAGQRAVMAEQVVPPLRVLTIGSTGVLAGGQFGTALSAVTTAAHAGLPVHVTIGETRPLLVGSRIGAWELGQAGIAHTIVVDAALPSLVAAGRIDVVLVGAERIAANGDLSATVGTYPIALAAARRGVPVVVAAPLVCIDLAAGSGGALPLEDGPIGDVQPALERAVAPLDSPFANPLFDVTPAELITAFVTEAGVLRPPFGSAIAAALDILGHRRAEAVS